MSPPLPQLAPLAERAALNTTGSARGDGLQRNLHRQGGGLPRAAGAAAVRGRSQLRRRAERVVCRWKRRPGARPHTATPGSASAASAASAAAAAALACAAAAEWARRRAVRSKGRHTPLVRSATHAAVCSSTLLHPTLLSRRGADALSMVLLAGRRPHRPRRRRCRCRRRRRRLPGYGAPARRCRRWLRRTAGRRRAPYSRRDSLRCSRRC
jgi:hypothetical protein